MQLFRQNFDPCYPCQTFDPCHPRHSSQNFTDPCYPCHLLQTLTHITYKPMHTCYPCDSRTHATHATHPIKHATHPIMHATHPIMRTFPPWTKTFRSDKSHMQIKLLTTYFYYIVVCAWSRCKPILMLLSKRQLFDLIWGS